MRTSTNEKRIRHREGFKRLINMGLSAICLGLEIGIFAHHWLVDFQFSLVGDLTNVFWFKGHVLEIAIYGSILLLLSVMYGGMRLGYLKNAEIIFSQVFSTLMANILIYA